MSLSGALFIFVFDVVFVLVSLPFRFHFAHYDDIDFAPSAGIN